MTDQQPSEGVDDGAQAPDGAPRARKRLPRAAQAAAWTTVGYGAIQILRLGSSLIMTRLLVPEVYGIMALVFAVNAGITLFSDIGIKPIVVQSSRGDEPDFLNTVWTVQALRGLMLCAVGAALGYPAALFFRVPELALLIPAVSLNAVIQGFSATSIYTEERRMNQRAIVTMGFVTTVTNISAMVAVAWVWPSPWAIVIGIWIAQLLQLLWSHFVLEGIRHRFCWDRETLADLFGFGRWIYFSSALTFLNNNGDRFIIARLLEDMGVLGVYSIATRLREAYERLHSRLVGSVLLPLLSERRRRAEKEGDESHDAVREAYYRARFRLDALFATGAGVLTGVGSEIVAFLYTGPYAEAGHMLEILAVGLGLWVLIAPASAYLMSVGDTRHFFFVSLSKTVYLFTVTPLAWYFGELQGLVWAIALRDLAGIQAYLMPMRRLGLLDTWKELRSLGFLLGGMAIGQLLSAILPG